MNQPPATSPATGKKGPVLAIAVEMAHTHEVKAGGCTPSDIAGPLAEVFTTVERGQANSAERPEQWLTLLLAIKRAVLKALGFAPTHTNLLAVEAERGPDGRWLPWLEGVLEDKAFLDGIREFAVAVATEDSGAVTATVIAIGAG